MAKIIMRDELIASALRALGADGLCSGGCGCGLDDLAPCGYPDDDCQAARRTIATEDDPDGDYVAGDTIYVPL